MIVYNIFEEVRIIIYLFVFGIYISTSYDVLGLFKTKKKIWNILTTIIGCFIIIGISNVFVYKLKEGFVPQYGLLIIIGGLVVYYLLLRKKFVKLIDQIRQKSRKMIMKIMVVFKPFKIFKTTFLLIKQKVKKLYIKTLYKKKEM